MQVQSPEEIEVGGMQSSEERNELSREVEALHETAALSTWNSLPDVREQSSVTNIPPDLDGIAGAPCSERLERPPETRGLLEDFDISNTTSFARTLGTSALSSREANHDNLPRFATLSMFTTWCPQINPGEECAKTWKTWWSDRRTALVAHLCLSILVFILNLILTIFSMRKTGIDSNGFGVIYEGNCDNVRRLNSVLHLAINGISTLLLGSSNFCMQLLIAPTREEVDHIHKKGGWMDIGIPSIHNLWRVKRQRQIGWVFLALSSIVLHLLWNSAVFASTPFVSYNVTVVTADYLTNATPWNLSSTAAVYNLPVLRTSAYDLKSRGRSFQYINSTECIKQYSNSLSGAGDLVIVTTELTTNLTDQSNNSSLLVTFQALGTGIYTLAASDWSTINTWLCSPYGYHKNCTSNKETFLLNQQPWTVLGNSVTVDYCLSSKVQDLGNECGLNYSPGIMITVCVMNFVKCIGIFYTFSLFFNSQSRGRPLVTIGDAIESFLNQADNGKDETTKGMCLVPQGRFRMKKWNTKAVKPLMWRGKNKRRTFSLAGKINWMITLGLCSSLVIISIPLFILSLQTLNFHHEASDIKSLWNYGLGQVHGVNVARIFKNRTSTQFTLVVGFANSWQHEISCLYIVYNALASSLSAAEEFSHFGTERKFLRVSAPKGMQRSTYFLSLPYRYGIPLSTTIGLLHWCVSQAVFLVRTAAFWPDGTRNYEDDSSRVGFSSIGIIFSIILGSILVFGLVSIGWFRKVEFCLPIVSTNSAAISAVAHCPVEDVDAYLLPVKWGITDSARGPEVPGHCCLTTARDADEAEIGSYYT